VRTGRTILVVLGLVFASAGSAGPVRADAAQAAALRVDPAAGPSTARVSLTGAGFQPAEVVGLLFDSTRLRVAIAAGDGSLTARIEVPAEAFPGGHDIAAQGMSSGRFASTRFTVRADWNQGGYDANHSVHNAYENVLGPSNVGRLLLAWTAAIPGGIYASPIVAHGVVYLGGGDGRMHAFDASTGASLWDGPPQGGFYVDSAAAAHGLVFGSSIFKTLRAYDAESGDVVWSDRACSAGVRASPTVVGDTLYLSCFTGTLFALDTRTGRVLWRAGKHCCVFDQSPAVDGGRVFQMRTDDTLTAYDAATGSEIWSQPAFSVGTVAAVHGMVFYDDYPNVVALDGATGATLWESPVSPSGGFASPAVADGRVFVIGAQLMALDQTTGDIVWTAPASSQWGPSVANGVVYASSLSGEWDAFDETDGSLLWSVTLGSGCGGDCTNAIPVAADRTLYLAGPDQYLRAYRLGS
jgi:outer membrane protein assembly factor BamB